MTTPVLLVHGLRTSRTMWRAQVEALERLGHPVLAIDLPGHGERRGERFTLDGAADAVRDGVRELTRSAPGRSVVVSGLSLGGYAALHAAARHPDGVGAVVAAGCCTSPGPVVLGTWALLARGIGALPDRGAGLNQLMVDRTLSPQAALDVAAGGFALDVMADVLREMSAADPRADLARITVPVWLVNGRLDHFRTQERQFVRAGHDVRLRIVPRAKHLVSLDAPVAFTRILLEAAEAAEVAEVTKATESAAPTGASHAAHSADAR